MLKEKKRNKRVFYGFSNKNIEEKMNINGKKEKKNSDGRKYW